MDITQLITVLISIIALAIGGLLIPYLIKKFGKEKVQATLTNLNYLISVATIFVNAVEQMYPEWNGEQKLKEVEEKIKADLEQHNLTYDEATIRAAIEQAVYKINSDLISELSDALQPTTTTITTTPNSITLNKVDKID